MTYFDNHIIYRGGVPRGGGLLYNPNIRQAVFHTYGQHGGGFLDSMKSTMKQVGRRVAQEVAKEAKKGTMTVARGLLEGKDLQSAVRDGSFQAVKNLKNRAVQEGMNRLNHHVAHLPDFTSQGRTKKRRAVQARQESRPVKKRRMNGKKGDRKGGRKKKRNQRGGGGGDIFGDLDKLGLSPPIGIVPSPGVL